jgi:CRP-like cAMP-binding protein
VVTECDAKSWDRSGTDRLMERHPRLAIHALEALGEELAETRARYQELVTERVEQRVARALTRLVSRAGKRIEEGVLIAFPLSRQDLAELTRTMLHTVSRILSRWDEAGIVKSGRQRVIIRKPHGLVCIVEDLEKEERI